MIISSSLKEEIINKNDIQHIVIVGMGGSGIGGNIVQTILRDSCEIPILVIKNYRLPAFVNEHTLVILSSYSGHTEEVLETYQFAKNKKAYCVCITSGGALLKMAQKDKIPYVQLPDGFEAPRACLGFSLKALLQVFNSFHFISNEYLDDLKEASELLIKEQNDIRMKAEKIAFFTSNKMLVLYGENDFEPVLKRIVQQLNENAKQLAIYNVIPEMNHNEIVGWDKKQGDKAVLFLRNNKDHLKNQLRVEITKEIVRSQAASIIEVQAKGKTLLQKMLYAIHFGDFLSFELAKINDVDVMSISSIDFLKKELKRLI